MKHCSKCSTDKPLNLFRKQKNGNYYAYCRPCAAAVQKEWRKNNKEAIKLINRKQLLKRYQGMSLEEFTELKEKQQGKCALCERKPKGQLNVDHCHKTGKVRGLLCRSCNRGIGLLQDSSELLNKAADYVSQ